MKKLLIFITGLMVLTNSTMATNIIQLTAKEPVSETLTPKINNADFVKVKRLYNFKSDIMEYLTNEFEQELKEIKNENAIKILKIKFNDFLNKFSNDFYFIEYGITEINITYADALNYLKENFKLYKLIKEEIKNIKNGQDPYEISEEQIKTVEDYTLSFQKDYINHIESDLFYDILSYEGLSQTGNMNFKLNSSYGNINLNITEYDSKLNLKDFSQEMDMKLNIDFDWKGTYDDTKNYSGNIYVDMNMKMFETMMYLTIKDFSFDIQNLEDSEIDEMNNALSLIKGKTVKINLNDSSINEGTIIDSSIYSNMKNSNGVFNIKKMFDILKNNSLLTPYKISGEKSYVYFKKETIEKLQEVFTANYESDNYLEYDAEEDINSGIILAENFYFKKGEGIIIDINDTTAKGKYLFSNTSNGFEVNGKIDSANFNEGNFSHFHNREKFNLSLKMADEFDMNISNENKKLDAYVKSPYFSATINGDYSKEKIDLNLSINDTNIGYYKMTFDGKNSEFDIEINLDSLKDFESSLENFLIKFTGKDSMMSGAVSIEEPTDAVDINSIISGSNM